MRPLRATLRLTAAVQIWFGLLFTIAPHAAAGLLGLPAEPRWVDWLFVMMGARFLGYGAGMLMAARDPARHVLWINTMIGIQLLDWVSTLAFVATGMASLRNVSTAAVLPPLVVAALAWWHPRRSTAATDEQPTPRDTARVR